MVREAASPPPDFARLKALLLGPEADELARVSARLDGLDRYVGDAPRLEAATADIIAQALRRAEVARHRELANAIAPLIVTVIRSEIKNSRDMMVEALYPITGRLVAAAVANALRELMARLNERLDKLTSTDGLKLRLRAALQGKRVSELALAEAQQARITRILFLERGSGTLVANWQIDGSAPEQADLVSGLIAAITEFAASALGGQGGQLRTLDLGASRVILRSSPRMIIAANCEGELRPPQEAALDAAFLRLLERQEDGDGDTEDILGDVAASIAAPGAAAPKKPGKALYVVGALVLGALLWWGVSAWLAARQESQLRAAFDAALAADTELAAYPLRLDLYGASGEAQIGGLTPDFARVDAIAARLRPLAFPRDVRVNVVRVPAFDKHVEQDSGVKALTARAGDTQWQGETLRRQARDDLAGVEKSLAEMRARVAGLEAALAQALGRIASAEARLKQALEGSVVSFAEDMQIDGAGPALAGLTEIAVLARVTGARLRVVGHLDGGDGEANLQLALKRARFVAQLLVARGLGESAVSTSTRGGVGSLNHHVTIEIAGP